jgi:2-isopropylmalate synthase
MTSQLHSHPKVTLYDTTLRDGTQGEGINFSVLDKLRIAEKLDAFGMHYIEGGWPGSNPKDVEFFEEAKKLTLHLAKLSAFGSTRRANLSAEQDPQLEMLLRADTPVVAIFGKSWKFHVTEILGITPDQNRAMIEDSIRFLKSHDREVIYDAEHFFDGYKHDPEHALAAISAARDGGADVIVLCDTNGGTMPDEYEQIFNAVVARMPGVSLGCHLHNDCGLAVANALATVRAGGVQIQGTVNGIGERNGNCNLTTVTACIQAKMGIPMVPDLSKLFELSHFVDEVANCSPDIRAPFVGSSAFAHKGGIHVHAVRKFPHSYEHIDPVIVGNHQSILISELSGQSNILVKAEECGLTLKKGSSEVASILSEVKRLENEGYEFEAAEASFELLMARMLGSQRPLFDLDEYHCSYQRTGDGRYQNCEATVKLHINGKFELTVAQGEGPVNALDTALRKALRPSYPEIDGITLQDYKVRIIDGSKATAARTRVMVVNSDGRSFWSTVGVSANIIEASWLALVDGLEYKLAKLTEANRT